VSRNIPRGTGLNSVHKKHFSLRRDATSRVIRDEGNEEGGGGGGENFISVCDAEVTQRDRFFVSASNGPSVIVRD
jgi:hypothetical protein